MLIRRVQASLRPGSHWLFADFVMPARGWARLRARIWLGLLYAFFRWQTGLSTRTLPDSERLLAEEGWRRETAFTLQGGMIRTAAYRRGAGNTAGTELARNLL